MAYKPILVLPTILLLVLSFTVVCAQPPPSPAPAQVAGPTPPRWLTPTPAPTQTVSQRETATAREVYADQTATARYRAKVATVRPTVTPRPDDGLGVSRSELLRVYDDDLGFGCLSYTEDGQENVVCTAPSADYSISVTVDFSGPSASDEVVEASFSLFNPSDDENESVLQIAIFLNQAASQLTGVSDWVGNNLVASLDGEARVFSKSGNRLTLQTFGGGTSYVEIYMRLESR